MRSLVKLLVVLSVSLSALVACKGGGGNSSVGGVAYTHEELAAEFVYQLNNFLGYDVDLEKVNTEQYDYVVVYDYDFLAYDAYYIGAFNPGENIQNYVDFYNADFFFNLDYIGGNLFEDPLTGVLFEEGYINRNLSKMEGQEQKLIVSDLSAKIAQTYSLSSTAADKIASAALTVAVMNKRGAGEDAYRAMMENVTGTNIDQWGDALSSGDISELNKLSGIAAKHLGTDSTDLRNTIGAFFLNEISLGKLFKLKWSSNRAQRGLRYPSEAF